MDHLGMAEDRISNLPWDILDNIFGRLQVTDAVRASVLSSKWRDKWVDLSKLVIDNPFSGSGRTRFIYWDELATLVYHLLLSHRGKIESFMLSTQLSHEADDLDQWMQILGRCDIMELVLNLSCKSDYEPYDLFFMLFSCKQLRHLSVNGCILKTIHTGLSNLVSLQLKGFLTDDDTLESLINSCPVLEELTLSLAYFSDCVIINSPNLKHLYLEGNFSEIYLENTPHLTDATFKMISEGFTAEQTEHELAYNLLQPPGCISPFQRLTLSGYFLRFLATRQGLPIACERLKVLELSEVHFDDLEEISVALSILRSSSNLKELYISVAGPFSKGVYDFVVTEDQLRWCFNQLLVVKIDISEHGMANEDAEYCRSDLVLIKLVLACSPVLEKMIVNYRRREYSDIWFMREMLSFKRASTQLIFKYTSSCC